MMRTTPAMIFCSAIIACASASAAGAAGRPFNHIVVVVDASGSYRARQAEAIAKAGQLMDGVGERRVKRWERADQVSVISLDASPDVIWRGTAKELTATSAETWIARFRGRSDYAGCTDVAAAMRLATQELSSNAEGATPYLYMFSDLQHEPAVQSVSRCAPPEPVPSKGVPWQDLAPVRIAAFWLPVSQKVAWKSAFEAEGITSFTLLSESESGVTSIDIPAPARRVISPEERSANRARLNSFGGTLIWWLSVIGVGLALLVGALALTARLRRQRGAVSAAPRPAGRVARTSGPIAPMIIPGRRGDSRHG